MLQVKLNISLICCSLRDFTLIQKVSFLIGLVFLNYEESLAAKLIGFFVGWWFLCETERFFIY